MFFAAIELHFSGNIYENIMATLSSPGIGSGLDINSLVTKLMVVEQQPLTVLNTKEASYQAKLSAFGTLKGAVSAVQTAASSLKSASLYSSMSVTSSDSTIASASATLIAKTTSTSVVVSQLAKAQSLSSQTYASLSTNLSTYNGKIKIQLGTLSGDPTDTFTADTTKPEVSISIDASSSSLEQIRDQINASSAGVRASVIYVDSSGYKLSLTSTATGAASAIKMTVTDSSDVVQTDSTDLGRFSFNPAIDKAISASSEKQTLALTGTLEAGDQYAVTLADGVTTVSSGALGTATIAGLAAALEANKGTAGVSFSEASGKLVVTYAATGNQTGTISLAQTGNATDVSATTAVTPGTSTSAEVQTLTLAGSLSTNDVYDVTLADGITTVSSGQLGSASVTDLAAALEANKGSAGVSFSEADGKLVITYADNGLQSGITSIAQTTNATEISSATTVVDGASAAAAKFTITAVAQDAKLQIDGVDISRSSNTISDAITGLTVTIAKVGSTTLSVARNSTAIKSAIDSFVKAYNDINTQLHDLTKYDTTSAKASLLTGDSGARSLQTALRDLIGLTGITSTSSINRLSDIGVTAQRDGSLAFNSARFDSVMSTNGDDIAAMLSSTTASPKGIAIRMNERLTALIAENGLLATRSNGITASIKSLNKQREMLNLRLTQIETRYRKQFNAMDSLVSSMQQTSSYLTQQLAAMTSSMNTNN